MKATIAALLLCAVVTSSEALSRFPRHSNTKIECTSPFDCRPGYCCTISNERYSYPRCQRLHEEGAFCRVGGPVMANGSRTYPDVSKPSEDSEVHLEDVYLLFCPCAPGLVCDVDEKVCRKPSEMKDFNYLKEDETGSNKGDD